MSLLKSVWLVVALSLVGGVFSSAAAARKVVTPVVPEDLAPEIKILADGVKLTMIAEHPDVSTPTGIDVDGKGDVWVVSSHTHFRPESYEGPEFDEVVVLAPSGKRTLFYNKTAATMDLELGKDGWVYLAERDRILRVKDTDGDGVGDKEEDLAVLETEADYPHNGLAGIAWDNDGNLIFSLGENFWKVWTLTGTDGTSITGTGEGGIFRCSPDGKNLERFAVGFWNPFGVCVREDGEMFVAENDPGARPPCRLIHLVEGGDYGYQRLYGRAPFHPFVAWNGELRSTLPMITGTGEAPCGIVPLGGGVLVPSWADHRIDFFPLIPDGATYKSERMEIVTGGDVFRPVCIAEGEPGVFYLSDWVFGSYALHGKGRVWKLEIDLDADWIKPSQPAKPNAAKKLFTRLQAKPDSFPEKRLFDLAAGEDAFVSRAAILALSRRAGIWTDSRIQGRSDRDRVTSVLAVKVKRPWDVDLAKAMLADSNSEVVFETLRWISDENLVGLKSEVEALFSKPDLDYRLFEACLASWNTLNGNPRAGIEDRKILTERALDRKASPRLRAFALRLLPANTGALKVPVLKEMISHGDPLLSLEAIRTLAQNPTRAALDVLADLVRHSKVDEIRAESILGLASDVGMSQGLIVDMAETSGATQREALRALRMASLTREERAIIENIKGLDARAESLRQMVLNPAKQVAGRPDWNHVDVWSTRLAKLPGKGDAAEGRRIFFHPRVAMCASCHRHEGRGKVVGPELSAVNDRADSKWLIESLMQPNKEVAPQFFSWTIQLKDGTDFTGIMLRKGGSSGKEFYRDLSGGEQGFLKTDIIERRENKHSLMPTGILAGLTDYEIRDLMTFLGN